LGSNFVYDDGLEQKRSLRDQPRVKTCLFDQPTQEFEIGVGREQNVKTSIRREPLACLIEQRCNVAVVRTGVPGAVRKVQRLASKRRRARQNDVE
jgi:hypothetical protein